MSTFKIRCLILHKVKRCRRLIWHSAKKTLPWSVCYRCCSISPWDPPHFYSDTALCPICHLWLWSANRTFCTFQTNNRFPVWTSCRHANVADTPCQCRWAFQQTVKLQKYFFSAQRTNLFIKRNKALNAEQEFLISKLTLLNLAKG